MEYWPNLDGNTGAGTTTPGAESMPGLKELSSEPDPVSLVQPVTISGENQPGSPANRRENTRYKCAGSAEFCSEASSVRTWGTVADISRSGCYIEMAATSPLDSAVNMVLEVDGIRVRAKGIVRTSYALLGMGIAFTEVEDPEALDRLLLHLAGDTPSAIAVGTAESPTTHSFSIILNPNAALTDLAKFFQVHDTLTRRQFTELLESSQNPHNPTRR